jgi:hypothetical protein
VAAHAGFQQKSSYRLNGSHRSNECIPSGLIVLDLVGQHFSLRRACRALTVNSWKLNPAHSYLQTNFGKSTYCFEERMRRRDELDQDYLVD